MKQRATHGLGNTYAKKAVCNPPECPRLGANNSLTLLGMAAFASIYFSFDKNNKRNAVEHRICFLFINFFSFEQKLLQHEMCVVKLFFLWTKASTA